MNVIKKFVLFPFAVLFSCIMRIRHFLYNKKIFSSVEFNLPVICVGNLALGGTGKSPMIEYLVNLLKNNFAIASLSRGYKRKTEGYLMVSEKSSAVEVGDEPFWLKIKHPDIAVVVCEDRVKAVPFLLYDYPFTEVLLLDDAFQHRAIKAGLNIVLSDYKRLYYNDYCVPYGTLRDVRSAIHRANIIIITKCPNELSVQEKKSIIKHIFPESQQQVFFTYIEYGNPYHILDTKKKIKLKNDLSIILITGIANPTTLIHYLVQKTKKIEHIKFKDHHLFSVEDFLHIIEKFDAIKGKKILFTTEKDAVRLMKFKQYWKQLAIYVIPIQVKFLFNEKENFNHIVLNYIKQYQQFYE
ncbi:MAG: tetraacyldisaccharide 4'-kinase, partial [Chitinophagaceae bacterium]